MAVEYRVEDDTYFERRKVGNQTIELGINYYDENAYDFGAHYEFNGLDVQNLKNPVFEKLNNDSTKALKK